MGEAYPGIVRACLLIAFDNGAANRYRSERLARQEISRWLANQPADVMPAIDAWLAGLSEDDLQDFCCGGEGEPERERIAASAPPFTDDLLNRYSRKFTDDHPSASASRGG